MLNNITLGQYYPTGSIIHQLDARTKIIGTFIFIITLFFIDNLWVYIVPTLSISIIIYMSKVPFRMLCQGLKMIIFIVSVPVLLNMVFTPGTSLISFWKVTVTVEGTIIAALVAIRIIILLFASTLMTLTTSPIELTDGIEALLKPFEKIGVPAHEIAMMMTIAIRFIPILQEETDKIIKAQKARGADFESGDFIQRAKHLIPILVPLFISVFRRAHELAVAMEARCYRGGQNRTRMKQLQFEKRDDAAFILVGVMFIIVLILKWI